MLTDKFPRFPLAQLPTPLQEMPRLRKALGQNAPRLLIKRDDQTGLATGGNKTRKLEFSIADALHQGADTVVTAGAGQSNHCRQTSAAAVLAGLRSVLVLSGQIVPREKWTGNLLLDALLGAEVRWAGDRELNTALEEEVEKLRAEGRKPYLIPIGASNKVGALGYVAAMEELAQQIKTSGQRIDRIVITTGSGGTQSGLLVGAKALGLDVRIEGMFCSAAERRPEFLERLKALAHETAAHLGANVKFTDDDFIVHNTAGGHDYAVITDQEQKMIRLLARTEAIIVDTSYTSRALAGLVEQIEAGRYDPDETILLWHTGGTTGLFARAAELMQEVAYS